MGYRSYIFLVFRLAGMVVPVHERPLDFITAKALAMEPNSIMLLTICSA